MDKKKIRVAYVKVEQPLPQPQVVQQETPPALPVLPQIQTVSEILPVKTEPVLSPELSFSRSQVSQLFNDKKKGWAKRLELSKSSNFRWKLAFGLTTSFNILLISILLVLLATRVTCFNLSSTAGFGDIIWLISLISLLTFYIFKNRTSFYELMFDCFTVSSSLLSYLAPRRTKIVVLLLSFSLLGGSSFVRSACLEIPLTNSTITTDKRTMYSVGFKGSLDTMTEMCMVTGAGSAYNVTITSWANKFSLSCYETDDPLDASDGQRLNDNIIFTDDSICHCNPYFREAPTCDPSKCAGNTVCNVFSHDSKKCRFMFTGAGNYAKKVQCFKGFKRFKICKIEQDDDFELYYKVRLGNVTHLLEHQGSYSVTGSTDKVQIRTTITYDNSFEGKYIVLDNNAADKMWLLPANIVNDVDSRDIRKLGWFRPNDDPYHLSKIEEQFTVSIKQCDDNNMTTLEKPLEIGDFLEKHKFYEFKNQRSYGAVKDNHGKLYYSDSASGSLLSEFFVIKVGFMYKPGKSVQYIGLTSNWTVHGANDVGTLGTTSWTLTSDFLCDNENVYRKGQILGLTASTIWEWPLGDGFKVRMTVIYLTNTPRTTRCYAMHIVDPSGLRAASKSINFWPNNIAYQCTNTDSYWYNCVPGTSEIGSYTFYSYNDKSLVDFYLQSTYSISVEELQYPKIESILVTCAGGQCMISAKSDTPVLVTSDDCFNDLIIFNQTKTLMAYADCVKVVAFYAKYQRKTIFTYLASVNVTKNTEIEVKMDYKKDNFGESIKNVINNILDIDLDPIWTWLKYYLVYVIVASIFGLMSFVSFILFIYFQWYKIFCCRMKKSKTA